MHVSVRKHLQRDRLDDVREGAAHLRAAGALPHQQRCAPVASTGHSVSHPSPDTGGSCDPWLEDFRQSLRYLRFEYDVNELLDVYCCDIPLSISKEEEIKVFLPKDILERLQQLDLSSSGTQPTLATSTRWPRKIS